MSLPSVQSSSALADRVQRILASRGLSLADLSRASGNNRPGHIPHSFYSSLRKPSFSPSLYQLHSVSRLTGYRLVDWFGLFGISLDDMSRFQVFFPSLRTVEIDPRIYNADAPVHWLYDLQETDLSTPVAPLSQWVALGARRRASSIFRGEKRTFRYVKIGSHDVLAFPDLLPGSIVRVSDDVSALSRTPIGKTPGRTLFLVRHSKGITCSRLCRSASDTIVLCSRHLPYAPLELTVGVHGVILGTVDVEIRSSAKFQKPVVSAALERYRTPIPLSQVSTPRNAGEFIQRARKACGISFREAAERTRVIARELGDRRYYCSPGALSDYETRTFAPRHLHKLISICAVYFAGAADLLEACGASLESAGVHAMPREFRNSSPETRASTREPSRFLGEMERRFGQLPYFLRTAGFAMFGLQNPTLRDVFWIGDSEEAKYSCLGGIRFLIVDRRQKRPRAALSCPTWAQPMYVLQKRGGGYLWGFCRLENGALSLCSPAQHAKSVRLRNGIDAEVIGRIVGVIRQLRR
jgi:transcriptional regulator with XRE-family HTH domain